MRIGFVVAGDLDDLSGGGHYDRMLIKYLREQGDSVDVVALPRSLCTVPVLQNFTCRDWRLPHDPAWDVIVQDELSHPSLFLANHYLKNNGGIPIVGLVNNLRQREQDPLEINSILREIEDRYLKTVDGVIGVSHTAFSHARERIGKRIPHIIAYPGKDLPGPSLTELEIMERAFQTGPLRMLYAGPLIRRKNLHTLIGALARLKDKDWRLDIAGSLEVEPSYVRRIIQLIISAGLVSHITIHGDVTGHELHMLFRGAHLFVMPSHYEGLGIAYLHAMGYGVPSIATFNGGASEVVHSGRTGFLVDPDRGSEIAHRIKQMHGNRDYLFHMSLAAARAHARFPSWEETCWRVRLFLLRMAGEKISIAKPGKAGSISSHTSTTAA